MQSRPGLDGLGARLKPDGAVAWRELGQAADAAWDVPSNPAAIASAINSASLFGAGAALNRAARMRAIMLASLRARRALPRLSTRLSVGRVMQCASSVT